MKTILMAVFILLLLPFAYAIEISTSSTNIESQYADLYVSVLKYEPYPVGPGEYFDLWLQIENKGLSDAKNIKFELQPKYPFSLDTNEESEREFSLILSHSSAIARYRVRVDENAVEGPSLVHYSYSINSKKPFENQVTVLVQTIKAILSIEDVKTSPETAGPGDEVNVRITVRNNAESYLRYITASMQLVHSSPASATAPSVAMELPFTPIGSGNEKSVYQIAPGKTLDFDFRLVVNPEAETKPYKIPISIEYFDELGKNYSRMEIVGLIVGSEPDIYTVIESSGIQKKGQSGEIKIKFVNKGTSPIKFLNVVLEENDDYKIVSSSQDYIGKIDSDDYDTATFRIYLKQLKNGKVNVPISYEFSDGNNKKYRVDETLQLIIYSSAELGTGGGSAWTIIFAIVAIALIYLAYREWAKKRKKKQQASVKN